MSDQPVPLDTNPSPHTSAAAFLERIADVLSPVAGPHPLHAPEIYGNAWAYVKDCLDTGWLSSVGKWVDRFEDMIMQTTGARHAIATVNGTAALHAALYAAGIRPGDEVIVPSFTFVASANAISYCGATPHFVDCETHSLGIDPAALDHYLDQTLIRRDGQYFNRHNDAPVRGMVPVHCYGHPADMTGLQAIAERYDLILIEDAAESLGSSLGDRHTGRFGRAGVLSFNGNKTITTGGGGAIITDDELLARRMRHLTTTARAGDGTELIHDAVGFNYRMPNLNAALGCAQLETLPEKNSKPSARSRPAMLPPCPALKGLPWFSRPYGVTATTGSMPCCSAARKRAMMPSRC
jgi:perosamine synthetase